MSFLPREGRRSRTRVAVFLIFYFRTKNLNKIQGAYSTFATKKLIKGWFMKEWNSSKPSSQCCCQNRRFKFRQLLGVRFQIPMKRRFFEKSFEGCIRTIRKKNHGVSSKIEYSKMFIFLLKNQPIRKRALHQENDFSRCNSAERIHYWMNKRMYFMGRK